MVESETRNKLTSSVPSTKRTLRWIRHSRSFKVILIGAGRNPERCASYVQLMPTLFLKLTKIRQRENGKFVDFNDPTQVWRRPSKERLWISTNDLYFQKLESLAYIFAADSVGLHSLVFNFSCNYASKSNPPNLKLLVPKPSFTWNSDSRSFEVIYFAVTGQQGAAYRHIILLALSLQFPKK